MTDSGHRWQPIDTSSYVQRLEQVKALLQQASALAAAQETARVAPLVELQHRLETQGRPQQQGRQPQGRPGQEQRGHADRRPQR